MPHTCRTCSRINPADALYCYHDGTALDGHGRPSGPMQAGAQPFRNPFVFPSGVSCHNFDELALACQREWSAAREMLQQGYLERFLGGLGRADLAMAAREGARSADLDRGLDEFIGRLPTQALDPAQLIVEPMQINLGILSLGQDRRFQLRLRNKGMRLLHGTVTCEDCIWLTVGDAPGGPRKLFQFGHDATIPVQLVGRRLRAGNKPLEGRLVVESNGGAVTVLVRAEVPVKPFPEGVLAGASSPRQVAEKAKASPREAALLFESGAVERWYKDNGWTYPVQSPTASGISAVQQFFEALGLTTPPKVEISATAVHLRGIPGERLQHLLTVETQEKRPVYASAVSDQPWLQIGRIALEGRTGTIPLEVAAVPARPSEQLTARVAVTANGNQRFWVTVTLAVGPQSQRQSTIRPAVTVSEPVAAPPPSAIPYASVAPQPKAKVSAPVAQFAASTPTKRGGSKWMHAVPVMLLLAALLGVVARDYFLPPAVEEPPVVVEEGLLDPQPRIAAHFHDETARDRRDTAENAFSEPSMRFGLVMLREKDPKKEDRLKRLTYDEFGRSNNTCLRIDGTERLFGEPRDRYNRSGNGNWKERRIELHGDGTARHGDGIESVWLTPERIAVRQIVEIVPGEQSRLLDTCRVRYILENQSEVEHSVGIRFMLDTFIGVNDGVPFTIPGQSGLCDTKMEFKSKEEVPDFIQALERGDLSDPGTIAHVGFRLGGRVESPDRVTLGAWPDNNFNRFGIPEAKGHRTGWDVPFLDIQRLRQLADAQRMEAEPDSAVVMYWLDRPLKPGDKREVGFTYGLGTVASSEGGGRLALTVGGRLVAHGEFTLTALVQDPQSNEKLTLTLPPGFDLIEGSETQPVPPVPPQMSQKFSPVTWKIRAGGNGKYTLRVKSNKNAEQTQVIRIRTKGVFD
jgi:hypothetical protein